VDSFRYYSQKLLNRNGVLHSLYTVISLNSVPPGFQSPVVGSVPSFFKPIKNIFKSLCSIELLQYKSATQRKHNSSNAAWLLKKTSLSVVFPPARGLTREQLTLKNKSHNLFCIKPGYETIHT